MEGQPFDIVITDAQIGGRGGHGARAGGADGGRARRT